jgi:hypothetical protein
MLHLAYTRHRLLIRLGTSPGGQFPRKLRASWWPETPPRPTDAAWTADLALLENCQHRLIEAIEHAPQKNLRRIRPGRTITVADELLGLAAHDAYHSGQIRLLARLGRK